MTSQARLSVPRCRNLATYLGKVVERRKNKVGRLAPLELALELELESRGSDEETGTAAPTSTRATAVPLLGPRRLQRFTS